MNIEEIRKKLANAKSGQEYWKSLDQIAETDEAKEILSREFPNHESLLKRPMDRRQYLKFMGSAMMMAGLAGCVRQPLEKIVPYVKSPEEIIPGRPLFFATAMTFGGYSRGLLIESHMGRPTKAEGNPEHPDSLGATDAFAQASVTSLYDPDRAKHITENGKRSSWDAFLKALKPQLDGQNAKQGAGIRILTESVVSPSLADQLKRFLEKYPQARWHQYEPINRDFVYEGSQLAFGEKVETQYHLEKADVIVALDSEFLVQGPGALRYAKQFSSKRLKNKDTSAAMNRLYSVESTPTLTGGMADHRLPLRAVDIEMFAAALLQKLGIAYKGEISEDFVYQHKKWLEAIAQDLKHHRGSSLVVVGEGQPASVHALAHVINSNLGNTGNTLTYTQPVAVKPEEQRASLSVLVEDLKTQTVDVLAVLEANPVLTAPADMEFEKHFQKAKFRMSLSLYRDETSVLCDWHLPATHFLESWADTRAFDGTVTIAQPLIAPLYEGVSIYEIMGAFLGESDTLSHDVVKNYWKAKDPLANFTTFWKTALHDGVVKGTAFAPKTVTLQKSFQVRSLRKNLTTSLEIVFRQDPTIWDGRFANNGWLQELPKPLTKLTWDNAALLNPETAQRLDVFNGDVVELQYKDRKVKAPVWILPGHAKNSVTIHLGYGRTAGGDVAKDKGFNAYKLRTIVAPSFDLGLAVKKTGDHYKLASTQDHNSMEGRHLVRSTTLENYKKHPDFAQHMTHEPTPRETLYNNDEFKDGQYGWGMTVNLNACNGCNACVIACQSENNIPVVGKEEVLNGREMQWIRIDRYYKGALDDPEVYHQPMMCAHCENAPCEPVCPVGATTHSTEGLNEMVYNRCVGTRYCSDNCPYKVRRFNYFEYAEQKPPVVKLSKNPDVTVRARGVMEKCTYCVQRINSARIEAKKGDRKIRDGEIVTACQAVCPTEAIVFGDVQDSKTRVSQEKARPLNYGLLTDLNIRPRTSYLAKVKNPNPALESGVAVAVHH